MDICIVLDNNKVIDMLGEMGDVAKDFNNMAEQTKLDIIKGLKKEYANCKGYIDIDLVIDELVTNPYKYLEYCDELHDCIVDTLNDLKNEYEDLENKIEELQDLSDIVPDVNKYIDQLTERLSIINSILPLADELGMKADWKGLADLLKIEI